MAGTIPIPCGDSTPASPTDSRLCGRPRREYGFGIGVWLSPWGGYGKAKKERIAYGASQGYETVKSGYALSGPRYYEKFEDACINFVRTFGVNQFKFDGTGNADQVFPGSLFDSDFSAAIHLFDWLRQEDNGIFINLTTGSKPSPFWLRYVDSVFRAGEDHSFSGEEIGASSGSTIGTHRPIATLCRAVLYSL